MKTIDIALLSLGAVLTIIWIIMLILKHKRHCSQKWEPSAVVKAPGKVHCILYTSYNDSYSSRKFVKLNREILTRYANNHGYTYKPITHKDEFMSPYWTRVYDLQKICDEAPDNALVMYFDADAIPNPTFKDFSIENFVESIDGKNKNKTDFYISDDPGVVEIPFYTGIFNTGVFIVRNTLGTRKLIGEWMDMYNKDHQWTKHETGWECVKENKPCIWSYKGYEQYSLTELYLKNPKLFTRLHWSALACKSTVHPNCFVVHLMGKRDKERETYFEKSLTAF